MKIPQSFWSKLLAILLFLSVGHTVFSQEQETKKEYKNQLATNLMLPIFESVDLTYERVIANKWAIGVAGAVYGDRISEISTQAGGVDILDTNYELMPFVRLYFQGAQNKSHFIELFGSLSNVEDKNSFVRNTNDEGFGVYVRGVNEYTAGGLGFGYGYRFLLPNDKWVLEAQFGIRTNFDVSFIVLDAALVRTGIKIGYRF
jgi:hypothetical protein